MDDEIGSPELPKKAKFVAAVMNGTEERINDGLYSLSFHLTKHYNSLKTKLKRILTTWMLATLVGFSYILSGKEVGIPIEKTLAASLAAIFSSRIVLLLLYLESKIYHRALNSSFSTNLYMEKKGISQSKIHINMLKSLLPEGDPEFEESYKKMCGKKVLYFKRFLGWIIKERGDNSKGIDPLFYDCFFYYIICFVLWSLAGYFLYLYIKGLGGIEFYGFETSFLIKYFSPVVSLILCIYTVKKSLRSGYQKFKAVEKSIFKKKEKHIK